MTDELKDIQEGVEKLNVKLQKLEILFQRCLHHRVDLLKRKKDFVKEYRRLEKNER
jgi:hypothetical protein